MNDTLDWVLKTDVDGFTRHFAAEALPVTIGGDPQADIRLAGVDGLLSIGMLDNVFFVQPSREARNLRIGGEPVAGARKRADGDVGVTDPPRIARALHGARRTLTIEARVTAGDPAPPALEELAREARADDEMAITPIAFRPGAGPAATKRARAGWAAGAAGVAFAVLALLAWFSFTAKSVEL